MGCAMYKLYKCGLLYCSATAYLIYHELSRDLFPNYNRSAVDKGACNLQHLRYSN
uniref:Uncharacterized protein n=1 Tax=Arundo donax TaxID=35708 RepID=A0A0A9B5X8_ARUDO